MKWAGCAAGGHRCIGSSSVGASAVEIQGDHGIDLWVQAIDLLYQMVEKLYACQLAALDLICQLGGWRQR